MTGRRVRVGRRTLELAHLDKVFFPDAGYTKQDVLDYYRAVAPFMLRHLRARPVMLQRFPDGLNGTGWYQKDLHGAAPSWVPRVRIRKEGGWITQPVCNDTATLLYLADLGTLAFHTWQSRMPRLELPDQIVFDFDPPSPDLEQLRQAVRAVATVLRELKLECWVKTTGSRGFHLVVPIRPGASFDQARAFARDVGRAAARRHPERLTLEPRIQRRGKRVFVDYLRNAWGQTAVAPYSLRAKPGAPVAMPLRWSEFDHAEPAGFTLAEAPERLRREGDPWQGFGRRRPGLARPRAALDRLLETG